MLRNYLFSFLQKKCKLTKKWNGNNGINFFLIDKKRNEKFDIFKKTKTLKSNLNV